MIWIENSKHELKIINIEFNPLIAMRVFKEQMYNVTKWMTTRSKINPQESSDQIQKSKVIKDKTTSANYLSSLNHNSKETDQMKQTVQCARHLGHRGQASESRQRLVSVYSTRHKGRLSGVTSGSSSRAKTPSQRTPTKKRRQTIDFFRVKSTTVVHRTMTLRNLSNSNLPSIW